MFKKRFTRALAFTVISALVMASVALADAISVDGDTISGPDDITLSGACALPASGIDGNIRLLRNNNNDLDPGQGQFVHFTAGESLTVSAVVTATPPAVNAGVSSAKTALTDPVISPWSSNGSTFDIPIKTTVSANGAYSVEYTVTGQASGYHLSDSFAVTANCTPANAQPQVAADATSVTVDEASEATMTGTWSDANAANTVTLSASVGIVVKAGTNTAGTWSWSYTPDDGPAESQTVTITANDGTGTANATNSATFELDVDNVAPTASLSGPSIAIVGQEVTFTASADDVSNADDAAGFTFSFDGGTTWTGTAAATAMYKTTFTSCGQKTVSVLAQDKDNGVSDPASVTTNAYNATFLAPLKVGEVNLVQKGRVIPVQISVSCDGNITGLSPTIQLLNGDYVSGVDVVNSDDNLVTVSVSNADTSGVMRAVDSKYLYNLQIPSDLTTNQVLTVRVRPWGTSGPSLNILLQIRK